MSDKQQYGSLINAVRQVIRDWPGGTFTARDIGELVRRDYGRKISSVLATVHLLRAYEEIETVKLYPHVFRRKAGHSSAQAATRLGKAACGCAAMKALLAITQGSRIRVYGVAFTNEYGIRRKSMALTDEQRRLVREATHGA